MTKMELPRPERETDGLGQPAWPVESNDPLSRVVFAESFDKLLLDEVPKAIDSPETALSLAGALVQAAEYWQKAKARDRT